MRTSNRSWRGPVVGLGLAALFSASACDETAASRDAAWPDAASPDAASPDTVTGDDAALVDGAGPDSRLADGPVADSMAPDITPADAFIRPDVDPSLSAFEKKLVQLTPNTWFEAPKTKMRAVCVPDSVGVRGVVGCKGVITAWNGGAWDSAHRQMLVWGGGHNDYWGNEIYAFDVKSGSWKRITSSSPAPFDRDPLADGKPVSRHTYGGLAFIAHARQFFGHGGSRSKDGRGTSLTWAFDTDRLKWTNKKPAVSGPGGYTIAASYDPATKLVLVRTVKELLTYDYDNNRWTKLKGFGFPPLWPRYERSGNKSSAVDTKRHLFWSVGGGDVLVWDIANKAMVTDSWKSTGGGAYTNAAWVKNRTAQLFVSGGGDIYDATAPGFAYDTKADQLVAWRGGAAYVLELKTKVWSKRSSTGAPAAQTRRGTYGRFAYLPAYNVFILVNDIDQNVTFYKNTGGGR